MSIEIGDYVEVKQENPYDSTIAALIAAQEKAIEEAKAEGKSEDEVKPKQVAITVPIADVKKTKFKVSRAANDAQRTARLRSNTVSEDGTAVTLVFTLTNRHKARRHAGDTKKGSEEVTAANEETLTEIGSKRPASSKNADQEAVAV